MKNARHKLLKSIVSFSSPTKYKINIGCLSSIFSSSLIDNMATERRSNRLILEKSPYLLQHAYNPVDWYPWGKEAFDKAAREQKLIFLSVGYSTCHWCHVMEHESFESEEIGRILNQDFVSIKVDREERPDVDKMYMNFVQATTGGGGWPMSVWLTPDLKPLVGGTYFPRKSQFGRPGFGTVLQKIANQWQENRADLLEQGQQILDAIKRASTKKPDPSNVVDSTPQCALLCQHYYENTFDAMWGGFGDAPKFPQPSNFEFLLYHFASKEKLPHESWRESKSLKMVDFTLNMMSRGGIHDHVAKGFHRYSTDEQWHVPHFEKMLYDQAQLASVFASMYQVSKEKFYEQMLRDVLTYVERDLKNDEGGFFSAEDADSVPKLLQNESGTSNETSKKKEGAFCVWTHDEIENLLGWKKTNNDISYAAIFSDYFTVKSGGNVDFAKDPHNELLNQNVLINLKPIEEICKKYNLTSDQVEQILDESKEILYKERLTRPKPHMDTKMITSWNAMMSSAFLKASMALDDKKFAEVGLANLNFIKRHLFDTESGQLLRCCYVDDEKKICQIGNPIYGFADDYANVIAAALDAYECTRDDDFVSFACRLQAKMDELFFAQFDEGREDRRKMGAYYQNSPQDENILIPTIEDHDGAEPSANSVTVLNQLRLYNLTSKEEYLEKCKQVLEYFGGKLIKYPFTLPKMMCSLLAVSEPAFQIVIVGSGNDPEVQKMLKTVNAAFLPTASVILLNDETDSFVCSQNQHLQLLKNSSTKKPVVYVCRNFTCDLPVYTASELRDKLSKG